MFHVSRFVVNESAISVDVRSHGERKSFDCELVDVQCMYSHQLIRYALCSNRNYDTKLPLPVKIVRTLAEPKNTNYRSNQRFCQIGETRIPTLIDRRSAEALWTTERNQTRSGTEFSPLELERCICFLDHLNQPVRPA